MSTDVGNLERLHHRLAALNLSSADRNMFAHYLVGDVSDAVPAAEWDAAVDRAVAFVTEAAA